MKKFFTVGMAAILGASLSFFACESATGAAGAAGEPGAPGANVGFVNTPVTDTELAALFKAADIVTLGPSAASVYGVVPAGKKLAVSGGTVVEDGEVLGIEAGGSVEVYEGATLDASYVPSTSGIIFGAADSVYGDGVVALPYLTDPNFDPEEDVLLYNNSTAPNKAVGSVTDGDTPPAALTAATVKTLLATVSPLTVYSLTGIAGDTVPSGKELNLLGTGNTATANIDLSVAGAGTLVVKEGAKLAVTTFSVKGVTNNGTITSSTTTGTSATLLVGLTGSGTILFTETVDLGGTATLDLKQNVTIGGSSKTLTAPAAATAFSGDKKITIESGNTLALPAAVTSVGATVDNDGTVTTATVSDAALRTIIGASGKITATGAITALTADLTVPEDVELEANTATLATGAFKLKVDGSLSATSATLAEITSLEVNGELTATSATLADITTLTVNGELTVVAPALTAITASTAITGTGSLIAGAVASDKAVLIIESALKNASLATTGAITATTLEIPADTIRTLSGAAPAPSGNVTVNGELTITGAAAPAGDVTVSTDGALNVSGSLTIVAGKTLANNGEVALTDTGSVVLKTAASGTTGGAKLTGTGKLTAQDTEIVGGTGGWLAVLDSGAAAETVTIASTATEGQAAITGSTDNTTASLAGGEGATITQKAGTNGNSLTLTTVTLDLSTNGSLTLKGAGTDGAKLTLAGSTAIINGAGTTGTAVTNSKITHVGAVAIANITIGDDVAIKGASTEAFHSITGDDDDNTIEATTDNVDVTLAAATTLTVTA